VLWFSVATRKATFYVKTSGFLKKSFFQFRYQRVFKNNKVKLLCAMHKCIAICGAVKSINTCLINKNNGARAPVKLM